jgi:hypothetical protein
MYVPEKSPGSPAHAQAPDLRGVLCADRECRTPQRMWVRLEALAADDSAMTPEPGFRGLIRRLDRLVEETPWTTSPTKQRVLSGAMAAVVVAAGMIVLGLIEKTFQTWLFAGIFWALSATFFVGLVVRPVAAGKAAIRLLAIALVAGTLGYLVFVIVLLTTR